MMSMISEPSAACRDATGSVYISLLLSLLLLVSSPGRGATLQPLEIVTRTGPRIFSVEIATTGQEKENGLMYRKQLADRTGMLFDFSPPQEILMWMKNTYISLDMIFIEPDGRILRIATNTRPQSTRIIASRGLARAVLEVPAGTAQKRGIRPGDRVKYAWFNDR
jgi:uncharacterized protein